MSRRDDWIRMGFGELDEQAVRDALAKDPQAGAEVEALRRLKADLRSLNAIPDHQLSTERLRDAVLAAEIRTRPATAFRWVWVTAPLGLVLAVVALNSQIERPSLQPMAPPSIASAPSVAPKAVATNERAVAEASQPATSESTVPSGPAPSNDMTDVRVAMATTKPHVRRSKAARMGDPRMADLRGVVYDGKMGPDAPPVAPNAPAEDTPPTPDPTVVVIDSMPEPSGTRPAVEVSVGDHGLIGG